MAKMKTLRFLYIDFHYYCWWHTRLGGNNNLWRILESKNDWIVKSINKAHRLSLAIAVLNLLATIWHIS